MCPACYINGFLFLIFGASGAAIASNPYVMLIATILTLIGFYWMWKAWKRRSKGKVMKNIKTTIIFILIFAATLNFRNLSNAVLKHLDGGYTSLRGTISDLFIRGGSI